MGRRAWVRSRIVVGTLVGSLVVGLAPGAGAAAGDLDPRFGVGGIVRTDLGTEGDDPLEIAVHGDGSIVVAGRSGGDVAVVRYRRDGLLDSRFGAGGIVTTDLGSSEDQVTGLGVQPDGKVVVAVRRLFGVPNPDVAVVRYRRDGSLDPAFGVGGVASVDLNPALRGLELAGPLALQPDGKIVVVATVGFSDLRVIRLLPDGSPDPGFGDAGVADPMLRFPPGDVAVQPGGNLVVGGNFEGDFAVLRLRPDGTPDPRFDGDGIATVAGSPRFAAGVAVQPDGKVVAVGTTRPDAGAAVVRFRRDGSLDPNFDGDGIVVTGGTGWARDVMIQPDGKVMVVAPTAAGGDVALLRYRPDGSLDSAFGDDGVVITDLGDTDVPVGIAAQPDGHPVVAVTSQADFWVLRYQARGPAAPSG